LKSTDTCTIRALVLDTDRTHSARGFADASAWLFHCRFPLVLTPTDKGWSSDDFISWVRGNADALDGGLCLRLSRCCVSVSLSLCLCVRVCVLVVCVCMVRGRGLACDYDERRTRKPACVQGW
jgi:hypothetical protein